VELQQADRKDKGYAKKKIALKKIVANMTMGNDSELVVATITTRSQTADVISSRHSVSTLRRCSAMYAYSGAGNQKEYGLRLIRCLSPRADRASLRPVVYLYLVNYGRTKADSIHHAISGFLSVSYEQGH
jgi:hypothetical protein